MTKLTVKGYTMDCKEDYQIRKRLFEMLYEDYQKPIERYLDTQVYNQEQASDLRQETFKQLWEFLCKETVVKQYAYYRNWLYKTATYRAIDYLRRKKHIGYLSMLENEAYMQLPELTVMGEAERIDDRLTFQDELLQLPPKERKYLLLRYHDGYSQKEIAEIYGISESAVSAYVSRGKTQLHGKIYPVAHSLQREILSWRQDAEKLSLGLIEDMKLVRVVLPGDELPYELRQRMKLTLVASLNCEKIIGG